MTRELEIKLINKYPKIFSTLFKPCGDVLEPIYFGVECGDGWYWLIDKLLSSIQNYIDYNSDKTSQVIATQIKEKFGRLNFYYDGGNEMISGMVWMAENLSHEICEHCGSTNDVGSTSGWIITLCEKCAKLEDYKNRNWKINS